MSTFVNKEIIVTLCSGGFALIASTGIASNLVGGAAAAAGVGAAGLGTAGIAPILGGLGLVGAAGAGGMALMSVASPMMQEVFSPSLPHLVTPTAASAYLM